jgi:hypothetical protein
MDEKNFEGEHDRQPIWSAGTLVLEQLAGIGRVRRLLAVGG